MVSPVLPPEAALLLGCARARPQPEAVERVRVLLRRELDWDRVRRLALAHGMLPLLAHNLRRIAPELVPPEHLAQLQDDFRANAASGCLLAAELVRLLERLQASGIPAIPLKGPALAAAVYGHLSLRQAGDLDLLLHPRDMQRARELFPSLGYRPTLHLTEGQEAARRANHFHDPPLHRQDGRVTVELHWSLVPGDFPLAHRGRGVGVPGSAPNGPAFGRVPSPDDPLGLWERQEPVCVAGRPVLAPPPEALLLLLCVHGCRHGWTRLGWICDVAELLSRYPGLDWDRIIARAEALGVRRMLFLGLLLARDLLEAPLPPPILPRLQRDRVAAALAARRGRWLFRKAGEPARQLEYFGLWLAMRERWPDRARHYAYLFRLALSPPAAGQPGSPPPARWSRFAFVVRPLRLARRYAPLLFKRLFPG